MIESYAHWVLRWRWAVIAMALALVAWAGAGAGYLAFQTDYRMFFSEDDPQLLAFENLQATYREADNVLYVLAPEDGNVFTRATLGAVERLTEAAWQLPYSTRVDSVTNFQHSFAEGDDIVVDDLVRDAEGLDAAGLARVRRIALDEPLLRQRLIAPEGDVTAVGVTFGLPGADQGTEVPEVAAAARKLAERIRVAYPGLELHLTGTVMMDNAFPEASRHDMSTLVPVMIGVVVVAAGLLLRAASATLLVLLMIALSVVPALGLAGWLGIALSPPSAAAPNIILTLAVADCVHVLGGFLRNLRGGRDKHAAMVASLKANFRAVFLTSLTTAAGFLSMNFSDSPPFRDLGNITAIGVGAAWVLTVTLLPALTVVLPVRAGRRRTPAESHLGRLAEWVIRRRNGLFWGMSALVVGLVLFIPRNELNDEFVKYFDESVTFRQATDFAAEHLTGLYYIDYSLEAAAAGGVSDPDFLARLEAFADWYRRQPEAVHVFAISDVFKRLNQNLHGDDPAWYRLPEDRALAAQYLLLYTMSLPYGLDLNDRIDLDQRATRMTVTLRNLSSKQVLDLERRAQDWLAANAPASMQVLGSGPTVMFAHIGQRNIRSMLSGVLVALVVISFTLVFAFRSVKIGLLSLVPNLVPAAMAFGLWGLLVGRVGLALSVVAAMTLGIVVDDTVHFLGRYLHARRRLGLSPEDAVRHTFVTVGTALWVTTVVLVAGFSVLAFSSFEINAGMGLLTAIAIGLALIADFLLLPALLLRLEEWKRESKAIDCTDVSPDLA